MNKSLLLLGGVLPAVQLLRRSQKFVKNIHIIAEENDAIIFSKYGKKFLYGQHEDCLSIIHTWIAEQTKNKQQWLVMPCSEFFVQYIQVFRNNGFEVFSPASQTLNIFYNKKAMYTWLDSLGVNVADFKPLDEKLDFTNEKRYIVKSAKASDDYSSPFKTKIISQQDELDNIKQVIPKKYWNNFVIQRLYKNNQSISYGGVWLFGQEVASIVARQVRQYPLGITSHTIKETNPDDLRIIKQTIEKIASNVELHGFIELEFIKNEAGLYPIDLNPRLWGWSNFLFYNYPQIPSIIIQEKLPYKIENKKITSWSNIWRDIPAIFKSKNPIFSKLKLFFSLFKISKKDFIFWDDIKPEFSAIFQKPGKIKNGKK